MSTPIKIKYPLFLRNINKGSVNEKEIKNIIDRQKGYPKINLNVVDNILILEAKANKFYNINNAQNDTLCINLDYFDRYGVNAQTYVVTFDEIILSNEIIESTPEDYIDEIIEYIYQYVSMLVVSKQNNKYKIYTYFDFELVGEVDSIDNEDLILSADGMYATLKNIKFIEPNYSFNINGEQCPIYIEQIENDNPEYQFKYKLVNNVLTNYSGMEYYYINTPIENTSHINLLGMDIYISKNNFKSLYDKNVGEFVFNIITPCNLILDCKWNDDNIPNTEDNGTLTISVVNGVGTYTFVPS